MSDRLPSITCSSHTAGLGDYWTDTYERAWDSISQVEQMMPFVHVDTPTFAPGTKFQYSNSGFILAGAIIQKMASADYFDYVREHIYRPLGMTETDSYLKLSSDTTLAEPLSKGKTGWVEASHGLRGSSAGGGYSTPRDMLRFMRGLKNGTVLKESSVAEMITPKNSGLEDKFPYGYGFTLGLKGQRVVSYGHGGQAPGINFEARYFPEVDVTFIIFSNQDSGAYDDLKKNIEKLITGDR
ncbi:MAG: serine hydrolase domain-containing protein [candidate division Zixibacteria bacterium]|nr:serine hydrolase domain-containing protein [candidate division Zixibacteria bacterium]